MLTQAQKKYLFAIYTLGKNGAGVKSTDVSDIVGVSKASTVKMTKRLCEDGYILKEHYGCIILTPEGTREANRLYTKWLIISDFLRERVGVTEQSAEKDSIKIVAHLSEDTTEKLLTYILGG